MKIQKEWQIFSIFLSLFAILTRPAATNNDASRLATIESLVDFQTFIIDNSRFIWTVDKYFYQGHFYSDKPPILSIYSSFFYAVLKTVGISFTSQFMLAISLLTILVVGASTAIGIVYLYKTLKFLEIEQNWINILLILVGTGTLLLPYSTVFSNHVVSASLLMGGFYYLLRVKEGVKYSLLSGMLISLAGSIDIAVFIFIPFVAIDFFNKPLKSKIVFALACALVLVIYFKLNVYTSGSLLPPSMNKPLWDYPDSQFDSSNLSGLAFHPTLSSLLNYAFHMIIGNRGLISYTPILGFSIFGFIKILSDRQFKYRQEYLLILLASGAYVMMYIFRSNNYSGYSYGVRWYANIMFLFCLPLAHISNEVKKIKKVRQVFIIIGCLSIFISFVGVIHPWVPVDEAHPSSLLNAFGYIFQPINTQIYNNSAAMRLSFSYSLLFVLKQFRVILIAAIAGLSCYLFVNRVKQFVANKPPA
ncbi:MAG: hypothetical protein JGK17_01855 [Microcoleus sp. PH2017_10_PVI_O_A]|uniref:hypothetical protein n=1 Tax=unclassified Microcoleus TaxID=2642155 RepID=UPI001DF1BBB9|nr:MULTISPECIES: hypothetical protein [unclassified Microcoleus]TAE82709.1 MAG: hypothetical protein EAZ83_11725 [Oscillatoriales cyanobacterium]MCC3404359.1 hypothetical protein [Microcoleus sp. PH2017_10_PVI_O_A]MCC3458449.1 hypothetical protein [Microcoleus sp. PH2017_11_PCY_U_A]MCC3477291.1 hypothetical protein [Microcoleus sp. PH2017_12_PCY_D_A]MCC3557992.1 hypothetical protein [Microcoleus sp. PH2017_27_LUM_O_A]